MTMRPLTVAALAVLLGGCERGSEPTPTLTIVAHELTSPAGPRSGEPFLATHGDAVWMSWLQASEGGGHDLLLARLEGDRWSAPTIVRHSDAFFVNWADFPSVTVAEDGALWAHWLERGAMGGYDYGVRVVRSDDGGVTWSEPWTPHDDASPTEHGFVSTVSLGDRMAFLWLDGRMHAAAESPHGGAAMTLRYREAAPGRAAGPEVLVDARVCDCCQTDAAMTSSGPIAVYRDRSPEEIRDIYVTRLVGGSWTEGIPVHEDGWHIEGCPVNGPAIAARGDRVVVAWFTGAGDVPRVRVAFSDDAGASFGPAVQVDEGLPLGRVDVLLEPSGSALLSWLEGTGGEGAHIRLRRVAANGLVSSSVALVESSDARASGFPRLAVRTDGAIVHAWTDVSGSEPAVRVQRVDLAPGS
jgi:hypothetical protein